MKAPLALPGMFSSLLVLTATTLAVDVSKQSGTTAAIKQAPENAPIQDARTVANLESAARANRTKVELLRAELATMRQRWKITDREPERLVIIEPKEAQPADFDRYVKRKGDFLKAKVESEKTEQALREAKAGR
jgi:hypothetical protein